MPKSYNNVKLFNIPLSIKSILFIYKKIKEKKSVMRITHEYFLYRLQISGLTADLGSGTNNSYIEIFKKKKFKLLKVDFYKKNKTVKKINLEKSFKISQKKLDTIILFNVLEHISNYKGLITQLKNNLKKGGKLELFVPFMFKYHEDPMDIFRPTHFYLGKLLKVNNFKFKTFLIAAGPMMVVLEIIFRYLKFNILKLFFFISFSLINSIIGIFSKDFNKYYCGIHCSCVRKK